MICDKMLKDDEVLRKEQVSPVLVPEVGTGMVQQIQSVSVECQGYR